MTFLSLLSKRVPAHKIFIEKPVTDYRNVHNPGFVFWTCSVTKLPFYQFSWVTLIFMKFCLWSDLLHDYQIFCKVSLKFVKKNWSYWIYIKLGIFWMFTILPMFFEHVLIVSPCRNLWCPKCWNQLAGNIDVYLYAKKSTSSNFFFEICKDIAILLF